MRPPRAAEHPYFDAPPLALAHRGGAGYPPNRGIENSLAAFRTAVGLGYRYLETDVHVTADGHLVAFHDDRLDRVTDGAGAIAEQPWAVVREARIGGIEPIPRLAELLEELPGVRLNIDIKASGAIGPLWETIRAHGAQDRVCVASFSDRRLTAFRRLAGPAVATAAGPREIAAIRFGLSGLGPGGLGRDRPSPGRLGAGSAYPAQVLQVPVVHRLGRVPVRVVTPALVERAHALGKQVHVWTVDDADEMDRLLDLGVDGLVSDRIDVLRDVLTARGRWT